MNVASLELCAELYDISKWGEEQLDPVTRLSTVVADGLRWDYGVPAYDLGYLLRKLPKVGPGDYFAWSSISDHKRTPIKQEFYACWECESGDYFDLYADTPENALCQLAIELFKQEILVKENVNE